MLPNRPLRRLAAAAALLALAAGGALPATTAQAAPPPAPRRAMGLQPSPAALVAAAARPQSAAPVVEATLPASVDLTQWAVPAGDQGNVGSCVSWTIGYTISGWYARRLGRSGHPYAPMFLYSQITNGNGGPNVGTTFYGNLTLETSGGIDPLADYPQGNYNYSTLPTLAQRANALNYRIADWTTLYWTQSQAASQGAALIKEALANNRPVALGINVYSNFFAVNSANPYYSGVSGSYAGRHAVAVLGYDAWGVRIENSWGTGWGEQGFAWLSWGFVASQTSEAYSVNGFNAPASAAAPTLSSLSSASGPWTGGETVTITGTNLAGAAVAFGTTAATSVSVDGSGTSLTATVPTGAPGSVAVAVTTAGGGRSNTLTYTYDAAAPVLASVSPAAGPSGGGTTVTIAGTNLHGPTTVLFGTRPATAVTVAVGGSSLTAVAPAGTIGPVELTVRNNGGTSNAVRYLYQWPATPVVTASAPGAVAPGGRVTVTGSLRHGRPLARFSVALRSRAAGSGDDFATVATGTTNSRGLVSFVRTIDADTELRLFIVGDVASNVVTVRAVPPPTVAGTSSTAGPKTGGQSVTVTGTNLTNAWVSVGGTRAQVTSVASDGTSLTFVTPRGRRLGGAVVIVGGATGSVRPFSYYYQR